MDRPAEALPDEFIRMEISKLMTETVRLGAETAKMRSDRAWQPVVLMTGAFLLGMALANLVV